MFGNVFYFLICLLICISVHELGHLLVARFCGVRVREFSIGFGYSPFSYTDKRGTVWKLSIIPFGGYVRLGDNDDISDMFKYSLWKRILILFGGPLANFLSAALLIAFIYSFLGLNSVKTDFVIINNSTGSEELIDGNYINDSIKEFLSHNKLENKEMDLSLIKKIVEDKIFSDKFSKDEYKIDVKMENIKTYYSIPYSIYFGFKKTFFSISKTFYSLYSSLFSYSDPGLMGPVRMVTYSALGILNISSSFQSFIEFIIRISIGVGFVNLFIPIVPLDGGQIILHCLESFVPEKYKHYLINGFAIFSWIIFLLLLLYIMYNDITKSLLAMF